MSKVTILSTKEDIELKIDSGILFINKHNINIDHVPYIKFLKKDLITILIIISRLNNLLFLNNSIPNEIIRFIGYNYFIISKIELINIIHKKNICPCSESQCLIKWFNCFKNFDIIISLMSFQGFFHCRKCHYIGSRVYNGDFCDKCRKYYCDDCLSYSQIEPDQDGEETICKDCLQIEPDQDSETSI